jgi:prepilin-type processing-associated H-X9-DG protein
MKLEIKSRGINAMTLFDVLVVLAVVVLLVALLLPRLARAKRYSGISCITDLKQTSLDFKIWSEDNDDKFPAQFYATNDIMMKAIASGNAWLLWQTMSNELSTPRILHCPNDRQTTIATNFDQGFRDANISYFFNPDATFSAPQMIFIGDDNIVVNGMQASPGILRAPTDGRVGWTQDRHAGNGNIVMADLSVSQISSNGLNSALASSGTNSVRLAVP